MAHRVGFSAHYGGGSTFSIPPSHAAWRCTHLEHLLHLGLPPFEFGHERIPGDIRHPLPTIRRTFSTGNPTERDKVQELSARDLVGDNVLAAELVLSRAGAAPVLDKE